ncbi:MAG: RNA polymerase sigma-70 factor (ECF subfamily) [Pseudoalteromonas distincta]|jgi:RNA polymerase sigma-70 factor (ECF subfamily)
MLCDRANRTNDYAHRQTLQLLEACEGTSKTWVPLEGFARALDAERPRQLRYLRARLPAGDDAEDVWQEAAIRFLNHAPTLAAAERPDAWMNVSLRRLVVDRYRRAAAQRRMAEAVAAEPAPDAEADAPDLATPAECLKATLAELRPGYAELLKEVYLNERPLKTVAADRGLSATNGGVRLHRARVDLRRVQSAKCRECALSDCWAKQRIDAMAQGA